VSDTNDSLVVLGGKPSLHNTIHVGQLNFPEWDGFKIKFNQIFERRYYTNHGPFVKELEEKIKKITSVKHAICVTNATIGLMIVAKALGLSGKVLCPSYTFVATAQSIVWAGLEPVLCDVNLQNHLLDLNCLEELINDASAILGVHLWGNPCHPRELEELAAANNVHLYFDSAHAFGCTSSGINIGNFGEAEVFSFHATKVINGMEGGCICTNDEFLASKIRNIRSSYGTDDVVDVPITGNGRMSEAQAAMAIIGLENYKEIQRGNFRKFCLFTELLNNISGVNILSPSKEERNNYQYVVIEIEENEFGLTRDELLKVLKLENIYARKYFFPGIHRSKPFCKIYPQFLNTLPVTDLICKKVLQLPSGQAVDSDVVEKICKVIKSTQINSLKIKKIITR